MAAYWPGFAAAGKETITVRQLLAHQAGLFAFDERVDAEVVADLDRLCRVMEQQRPIWPPCERQAYHAITLGFGYGYVTDRMRMELSGDRRDVALRRAVDNVLARE